MSRSVSCGSVQGLVLEHSATALNPYKVSLILCFPLFPFVLGTFGIYCWNLEPYFWLTFILFAGILGEKFKGAWPWVNSPTKWLRLNLACPRGCSAFRSKLRCWVSLTRFISKAGCVSAWEVCLRGSGCDCFFKGFLKVSLSSCDCVVDVIGNVEHDFLPDFFEDGEGCLDNSCFRIFSFSLICYLQLGTLRWGDLGAIFSAFRAFSIGDFVFQFDEAD